MQLLIMVAVPEGMPFTGDNERECEEQDFGVRVGGMEDDGRVSGSTVLLSVGATGTPN